MEYVDYLEMICRKMQPPFLASFAHGSLSLALKGQEFCQE